MSKDRFWKTIERSYHICLAWTNWYYFADRTAKQKKKFIKNNGQQFMDNFTFWMFVYSYSNRSQVYYQSMAIKVYKFKNPATGEVYYQYYFMFDTLRNFEKMHRAPDEAFFGLGVANNLLVAFYHEFLPCYVGASTETLALAYSPKNSSGKGFTAIIKRITLQHGGVELNNQFFRTHYNSHIKDMSDLTEKEKCILDKVMNHSRYV